MNTIAKAKGLLVEPGKTWDGIAAEPSTFGGFFARQLLPLAPIPFHARAHCPFLSGKQPKLADLADSN